jgi:hypothetical protein
MQADGNLVAYRSSDHVPTNAFWQSDTANRGVAPYRLQLQGDGNLVVYDSRNQPTWASGSTMRGVPAHRLVIQDDRNIVLFDGRNQPIWATNTVLNGPLDMMYLDGELHQGQQLRSPNGLYTLTMQVDGNLVAYAGPNFQPQAAFWATHTNGQGKGPYALSLDRFGNLGVHGQFRQKVWESNTRCTDRGIHLQVQDDRNIVLYDGRKRALWASNTAVAMGGMPVAMGMGMGMGMPVNNSMGMGGMGNPMMGGMPANNSMMGMPAGNSMMGGMPNNSMMGMPANNSMGMPNGGMGMPSAPPAANNMGINVTIPGLGVTLGFGGPTPTPSGYTQVVGAPGGYGTVPPSMGYVAPPPTIMPTVHAMPVMPSQHFPVHHPVHQPVHHGKHSFPEHAMPAFGVSDTLMPGKSIKGGEYMRSKWLKGHLVLTKEGNLVLYDSSSFTREHVIWETNTGNRGHAPYHLDMQADGNLVIYDKHEKPTWASDTWQKGHKLLVQDDYNVVVYDQHMNPVWATNTGRS